MRLELPHALAYLQNMKAWSAFKIQSNVSVKTFGENN